MTNLETLKKHIRTVTEVEWCGLKVFLRKLSADDHLAIFGQVKAAGESREATVAMHVELVARTWANANGDLEADSDDGRATIRQIGFDDLVALGELVLANNGYGNEKKSTAETSCSPLSSAETLDPRSSTPTTSPLA